MKHAKIIIFLMLFSLSMLSFPGEYSVVVNKANPVEEISAKDLQMIFLGEKTTWEDGNQIKLAVVNSGDLYGEFARNVVKMTAVQFSMYWKQKIFTGSGVGTEIKFFNAGDKLKEYVAATPEAIGYIHPDLLDGSIKQVKVI
jgi:ABC-type phosphate transport system substrate-binding protein